MATRQRDGLGLVLKAIEFAAHKHRDQRRKNPDKTPSKAVVDEVRGANARLERRFNRLYQQRPEA